MNGLLRHPRVLVTCTALALSTMAGCAPAAPDEAVATATSDLTEAQVRATIAALGTTITELRARIHGLESEIHDLETENATKLAEITALVDQIAARKKEVEDDYRRQQDASLIACAFGYCPPPAITLMFALDNDARVRELEGELAAARARQAEAQAELAAYEAQKADLSSRVDKLQDRARVLEGLIAKDDAGATELERLVRRADRMTLLSGNLTEQATVLGEIRDHAARVGVRLDQLLADVVKSAERADTLAAEARERAMDLVNITFAADPHAAAEEWLEKRFGDRLHARNLMQEVGISPGAFVERLVRRSVPGSPTSPAAKELRRKLLHAFKLYPNDGTAAPAFDLYIDGIEAVPSTADIRAWTIVDGRRTLRLQAVAPERRELILEITAQEGRVHHVSLREGLSMTGFGQGAVTLTASTETRFAGTLHGYANDGRLVRATFDIEP